MFELQEFEFEVKKFSKAKAHNARPARSPHPCASLQFMEVRPGRGRKAAAPVTKDMTEALTSLIDTLILPNVTREALVRGVWYPRPPRLAFSDA